MSSLCFRYWYAKTAWMPERCSCLCRADTIPGAGWPLAQGQYSYDNRYFATASYRIDASSTFGPERRIGYFPSVSGSWLLSNEEFLKDSDLISFLKLRASYGVTGNSNIGSFRYLSTFPLNSTYQDLVGATPERSGILIWLGNSLYVRGLYTLAIESN